MNIRGKEYDEQQFAADIQKHMIDWLWPLPPRAPEPDLKGARPSDFKLAKEGLTLYFAQNLDIRDLEYFRICYNNTMLVSYPYMRPATVAGRDGKCVRVFFPWGKKPHQRFR